MAGGLGTRWSWTHRDPRLMLMEASGSGDLVRPPRGNWYKAALRLEWYWYDLLFSVPLNLNSVPFEMKLRHCLFQVSYTS